MLPKELKYTKEHEWVKIDGDEAVIGVTDYAQSELGDIIFIELPSIGDIFQEDDVMGTIEAVKTVADIFSPLAGKIIEINNEIENSPEFANSDPYNKGWLVKMKCTDKASIENLLDSKEYSDIIS